MKLQRLRRLTNGILSVGLSPDMRSINLNRALVATLSAAFVLVAVRLASDLRAPKPIPADEFIRALDSHQTSLVNRYFRDSIAISCQVRADRISFLQSTTLFQERISEHTPFLY